MAEEEDRITGIQVHGDTWKRLLMRKSPGDSFDDVINDALTELEELQERVDELEAELEDVGGQE